MRKDQIFVLLLVVLLPMTGCFGDTVGEADAQEQQEPTGISIPNNMMNVHVPHGDTVNITLNGTTLEFKSAFICVEGRSYCETYSSLMIELDCEGVDLPNDKWSINRMEWVVPNPPNTECVVSIANTYNTEQVIDYVYTFVEHPLV